MALTQCDFSTNELCHVHLFFLLFQEITCKVGCGTVQDSRCGVHTGNKYGRYGEVKEGRMQQETKARSLWSRMTFRRSTSDSPSESGSDVNAVIGGIPACIFGQFGEIAIFMEPLLDAQIQSLFKLGMTVIFLLACETETAHIGCIKLLSKKVQFSYLLQQNVQKWTCCCSK